MVLSTADRGNLPTSRIVLLKGVDAYGFRFFTNTRSRKARAMADNPRVSLLFPWHALHRQVTVLGTAIPMSLTESEAYFKTRPKGSQWSSWASMQSEPVADRGALELRMAEIRRRFPEGTEVPKPETWGGYCVCPESVEFWHGRESRLHDRLRFEASGPNAAMDDPEAWQVRRYSP